MWNDAYLKLFLTQETFVFTLVWSEILDILKEKESTDDFTRQR